MGEQKLFGTWGKVLRVDMTRGTVSEERVDGATLRKYWGGTGLGTKYLIDEVDPGQDWSHPDNILFVGSGPLGGTGVPGSGTISFVTKGAMTNGATSTQANGNLGTNLKRCGYDAIVIKGKSSDWKYLYVHDHRFELKDAVHLLGRNTWDIENEIKHELNAPETMSVFSIGPAGENLVRFSGIFGDRCHAAAHNGVGAVMGSKKLKAIAVARGDSRPPVFDKPGLAEGIKLLVESAKTTGGGALFTWGTSKALAAGGAAGWLPVKNYQTNIFPEYPLFAGDRLRSVFETTNQPCYGCPSHHFELMKATEGPYAGYSGREPEYECWAAWGPQIGQKDPGSALMLSNEVDRLGMDSNEASWVVGWVMECYEKKLLSKAQLDGLDMTWGNVEATLTLLKNMANRRGFGDLLAEGVKRAAEMIGGEATKCAIYTEKGNTPRGHDHRGIRRWELLDTCVSNTGTLEMPALVKDVKLWNMPQPYDPFNPEHVAANVANTKGCQTISDCAVICWFIGTNDTESQTRVINAVTGWDLSLDDAMRLGKRVVNLQRLYNIRVGIGPELEKPSARYGSTPVDGPAKGMSPSVDWEHMMDRYYELMGWDRKTGKPQPETIKRLELEDAVPPSWLK